MNEFVRNEDSSVYYQGRYWNDLPVVADWLTVQVTGEPEVPWRRHFARRTGRTFERALFLNCGNGWVERELLADGIVGEAVGVDYADDLLAQAQAEADAQGLAATYHQMDTNTAEFPTGPYDLVVNFAAAHHIAFIDRVFRAVSELLVPDGWFVSHDYVGPHRNQYEPATWEAVASLNEELPEHLRQRMGYPHLPDMLVIDPTEAIHSELIVETFHRYFMVDEFVELGGALAYPLLTHNDQLFAAAPEERAPWVDHVMAADRAWLAEHPGSSLFAYFSGQPDGSVLERRAQLATWAAEEDSRERRAAERGGEYYRRTALAQALIDAEEGRRHLAQCEAARGELAAELAAARATTPAPATGWLAHEARRVAQHPSVRRLRDHPRMAGLERRLRHRA